jgi:beta-phosphoglucomutase
MPSPEGKAYPTSPCILNPGRGKPEKSVAVLCSRTFSCYAVAMSQGAIFDMDGVLVDNLEYHIRAWQQLGREHGRTLSREAVRRVFGQRNDEMIRSLFGSPLSRDVLLLYATRKEEIYRALMAPALTPVPGLPRLLAGLKEAGMSSAVATSGPRENANLVLDGLNLRQYFDAVITGDDVSRSKPHPDIFLLAARRIGLPPERCVVFEDSSAGIEAASRAGCLCIALSTTHPASELQAYRTALIVPDFTTLSASSLMDLPEGTVKTAP